MAQLGLYLNPALPYSDVCRYYCLSVHGTQSSAGVPNSTDQCSVPYSTNECSVPYSLHTSVHQSEFRLQHHCKQHTNVDLREAARALASLQNKHDAVLH